jgi:hypothetical protein
MKHFILIIALALATTAAMTPPISAKGKLDETLDDWWNALDNVCRGEPGGSEAST